MKQTNRTTRRPAPVPVNAPSLPSSQGPTLKDVIECVPTVLVPTETAFRCQAVLGNPLQFRKQSIEMLETIVTVLAGILDEAISKTVEAQNSEKKVIKAVEEVQ